MTTVDEYIRDNNLSMSEQLLIRSYENWRHNNALDKDKYKFIIMDLIDNCPVCGDWEFDNDVHTCGDLKVE